MAEITGGAFETLYHTGVQIDEVLGRYAASGERTLLQDALMSVIAQTNDTANAENFYAYSAYGEAAVLGPDSGNSLRYTGREDDAIGLYYYRARYYDPVLKRFISEDPIGLAGGDFNLYAYVSGNPVSLVDPTGWAALIPPNGDPSDLACKQCDEIERKCREWADRYTQDPRFDRFVKNSCMQACTGFCVARYIDNPRRMWDCVLDCQKSC